MTEEYERLEVRHFATQMERVLREHDYKGGWEDCTVEELFSNLLREVVELHDAIRFGNSDVLRETCDVANFALMIADRAGRLPKESWKEPEPPLPDNAGHFESDWDECLFRTDGVPHCSTHEYEGPCDPHQKVAPAACPLRRGPMTLTLRFGEDSE